MKNKNGWSKMPHAISGAMAAMSLPELACTMLLVRETYGWHRSHAWLTYQNLTRLTAVKSKSTVAIALNAVEAHGFFRIFLVISLNANCLRTPTNSAFPRPA